LPVAGIAQDDTDHALTLPGSSKSQGGGVAHGDGVSLERRGLGCQNACRRIIAGVIPDGHRAPLIVRTIMKLITGLLVVAFLLFCLKADGQDRIELGHRIATLTNLEGRVYQRVQLVAGTLDGIIYEPESGAGAGMISYTNLSAETLQGYGIPTNRISELKDRLDKVELRHQQLEKQRQEFEMQRQQAAQQAAAYAAAHPLIAEPGYNVLTSKPDKPEADTETPVKVISWNWKLETTQNDDVLTTYVGWTVTIKNSSSSVQNVWVDVKLYDQNGYTVSTDWYSTVLQSGQTKQVGKYVYPDVPSRISRMDASVSAL
jgi:hypothetical protein